MVQYAIKGYEVNAQDYIVKPIRYESFALKMRQQVKIFALCNSCYYVNLYYVTGIEGYVLKLGNTELQLSHTKKKDFLKALNDYVGQHSTHAPAAFPECGTFVCLL